MTEEEISRRLRKMLSPKLYNHCAGVAETAGRLAESLGTDVEKARLAGWLHDAAREWPENDCCSLRRIIILMSINTAGKSQPFYTDLPVPCSPGGSGESQTGKCWMQ